MGNSFSSLGASLNANNFMKSTAEHPGFNSQAFFLENSFGNMQSFQTQSSSHSTQQGMGSPTQVIFIPNYDYGSLMGNFQLTPMFNLTGNVRLGDNTSNLNNFASYQTIQNQIQTQNSMKISNQVNFEAKTMANALSASQQERKIIEQEASDAGGSHTQKNNIGFVRSRTASGNCFNHGESHE